MSTLATAPHRSVGRPVATVRPLALPVLFAAALASIAIVPSVRTQPHLQWSIVGAAAILLAGVAFLATASRHRALTVDVQLRAQHYLQASMQGTVLAYWGYYWRPVYDSIPLIAAQLAFAYAFDMLLAWSRRDNYTLGFAPFPVIFSINLFLWFKPEWFYLQFLMIAVGFAAKELIRWEKQGRRTHIFNPSSFPLAVFSLALIATGATSMTYGVDIARTQFNPPNIYVLLFLIGLPSGILFGVATMTMSAVVTTYLFGLAYFLATGTYFFIDSYVPIAVFLGMHLLFTDPSTSPRTELGRIIFGVLYGLGNVVLYALLTRTGIPAFYDKLLPVPILNLSIRAIDRLATSSWLRRLDPARLGRSLVGRPRNAAYVAVWTCIFIALLRVDGLGDHHPGHQVPFWQQACQADRPGACGTLAGILDTYCADGSGWSCNEVAVLRWHNRAATTRPLDAQFTRACALGFAPACQNAIIVRNPVSGQAPRQGPAQLADYPVVLRTGKGALKDTSPLALYTEACAQGWMTGCNDLGGLYIQGRGVARDPQRAAAAWEQACTGGMALACSNLGYMQYSGDGVPRDQQKGLDLLKRACDLGMTAACQWLKNPQAVK